MTLSFFKRSPKSLVILFFLITALVYFDRGLISGLLPKIKSRWGSLTGIEEGLISSAFTVSFMICCPLFAYLAASMGHIVSVAHIMSFGFFIYGLSAILCGIFTHVTRGTDQFWGYYCFIVCRTFVGVGESAFIALSVSIVDDVSSDANRTSYQSVLLAGAPIGTALGYTVAGIFANLIPWQMLFYAEGGVGLLVALLFFFLPVDGARNRAKKTKDKLRQSSEATPLTSPSSTTMSSGGEKRGVRHMIWSLITNPVYMTLVLGKTQYIAVIGSLSFWAPTWILSRLDSVPNLSDDKKLFIANFGFSLVLILSSILGTIVGGITLDRLGRKDQSKNALMPARGSLLITIFVIFSVPIGLVIFLWTKLNIYALFCLLALAVIALFCCQSPFQVAMLACCEEELRDFAVSLHIFAIRLLGDLPSPTLFGLLSDVTNLDIANAIQWCLLIPTVFFYALATILAYRAYKRGDIPQTTDTKELTDSLSTEAKD